MKLTNKLALVLIMCLCAPAHGDGIGGGVGGSNGIGGGVSGGNSGGGGGGGGCVGGGTIDLSTGCKLTMLGG